MGFVIVLLTVFIVLNCLLLVLLVLMQLPKKEAGAGLAFGGAATDALFGAGSGNLLTKATKYAATSFFVLSIILGILQRDTFLRAGNEFRKSVEQGQQSRTTPPAPGSAVAPVVTPEADVPNSITLPPPTGTNNATPPG